MSNQLDFSPSFLVFAADLGYFFGTARKYKNDAISLKRASDTCTPSFHLLSTLALELFPKVLLGHEVCLKYREKTKNNISQNQIKSEVAKSMSNFGHNIQTLYANFPELMTYLNIEKIDAFKNKYIWEYRIKMKDSEYLISIKDIEAVRYGSFAKNSDIMTDCTGDDVIIDLLNKVTAYVSEKRQETKTELQKYFGKPIL